MYMNVMLTIITVVLLCWFLYNCVFSRWFYRPGKALSKFTGHSEDFFDVCGQMQAEFRKGNFQQAIELAETLLEKRPYGEEVLSYKAYSLFHMKQYEEAKEAFELLDSLPKQDCTKMLEKINEKM